MEPPGIPGRFTPRLSQSSLRFLTDDTQYDPQALARRHYRENLWLRHLLTTVAQELERMAARGQGDTRVLLGRAQRVRRSLHQGVPEGWSAER
jgi:hypothetical protein